MICLKCGKDIPLESLTCPICGSKIKDSYRHFNADYIVILHGNIQEAIFANVHNKLIVFKQNGSYKGPYHISEIQSILIFNETTLIFDYPRMGLSEIKMSGNRNHHSIIFDLENYAFIYKTQNKKKVSNILKLVKLLYKTN